MKISDIADIINVSVKDPSKSGIDIFVGLEHYDIAEPVITRYGSTKMLSTAAKKFESGDVLIARRNVYLQRASVVRFSGLTSGDSIVLRVKKNLNTKDTDYDTMCQLLPFILNSINFWDYANTNSDGTMSKRLSPAMLLDYEFDLPSIKEQKVLAEKLWAAYEVKQSYLKMIEATQEMVKSQFIEMFKEVSHKVTLENVVNIKDDCRKPINDSVRSTMKSGELYPYYGATGVVDYVNDYITNEQLLCIAEDCGNYRAGEESSYIIDGKAWVNNHAHVVKPKDTCSIEYLHQYLKMQNLMPYVSGTTRLKLTQKKLKEIPVILPDKERQMEFVAITKQADKSEFELRKSIEAIDAVIKSLINS